MRVTRVVGLDDTVSRSCRTNGEGYFTKTRTGWTGNRLKDWTGRRNFVVTKVTEGLVGKENEWWMGDEWEQLERCDNWDLEWKTKLFRRSFILYECRRESRRRRRPAETLGRQGVPRREMTSRHQCRRHTTHTTSL